MSEPTADVAVPPAVRRCGFSALALLAGLVLASAAVVYGTEAPREVHGISDASATPGVAMAWGIVRGASETATVVVARIVTDPARYPWLAVTGSDPFTHRTGPLLAATRSAGVIEVRSPRPRFAELPRTEFRFYESAAAAQQDTPALVVFFLGVPDTTPEFATEDKLQAYLGDRVARLAGAGGAKPP
ncbi:MAG TPA: hypothetical protein VN326_10290 [Casimicrobiaceae bacterium]|nr:hypothetical protein [Casimicrobiaceae bacterium]